MMSKSDFFRDVPKRYPQGVSTAAGSGLQPSMPSNGQGQMGQIGQASTRPATILVADDDKSIRTVLSQALGRLGHHVRATGNGTTLWKWVQEGAGDMVITDVMMPDSNGLDLLPNIRHIRPDLPIIVMSAQNTLMTAVTATERGAYEYLPKPFDLTELTTTVSQGLSKRGSSSAALDQPGIQSSIPNGDFPMAGRSPAMQEVFRVIARVVGTPISVMLHGEAGTGKELVARTIHGLSGGQPNNFVVANLSGLSAQSVDEVLLGHPADGSPGILAQAQGGTLFLDEVGDISAAAQGKLVMILQAGQFTPVGGSAPVPLGCRIVSASHRDLSALVAEGLFRADLLYRLDELPLFMPALRDRTEDIPELVDYFIQRLAASGTSPGARQFDDNAKSELSSYHWPGNVRELENFVKRLLVLYSQAEINVGIVRKELENLVRQAPVPTSMFSGHVQPNSPPQQATASGWPSPPRPTAQSFDSNPMQSNGGSEVADGLSDAVLNHLKAYFEALGSELPPPGLYHRVLREIEKPLFELCLDATKGNQIKTAELLGLNRNTVRKKLRDLEIEVVRGVGSPTSR